MKISQMTLAAQIKEAAGKALQELFPGSDVPLSAITVNRTTPEFPGVYTVVLFPFLKLLRKRPDELGALLGNHLKEHTDFVSGFEIAAGFLNLSIRERYWLSYLESVAGQDTVVPPQRKPMKVMVEFSSPNTNKPLHFGHMRNIFLGHAVSAILEAAGEEVVKANLINDRGIHICKSMIAWMRYADGATPQTTGIKGDHFVGDYYVRFNEAYKEEVLSLVAAGKDPADAEKEAPVMKEAQELLRKWESGDPEVYALWKTMNGWVYQGFDATYQKMGIEFDKVYYESDTYLLGREIVLEGIEKGVLYREEDGSAWIDLTGDGLDRKLLLRGDGTSVYMTQDLGTARLKYEDFHLDKSIYVIGDEQNYHMQVLKLILEKLSEPCAAGIHHLSYGMVELPTGKMKSREGTVVDADDMISEMIRLAQQQTELAGKTEGFDPDALEALYETIGLGALKFYLLRVDPRKKMIFNPQESIDLHGFTATFIQYAHARICSVLRREGCSPEPRSNDFSGFRATAPLFKAEEDLCILLEQYPAVLQDAASELNPSLLCQYAFQLAQLFNSFYAEHSITQAESGEKKMLRLMLSVRTAFLLRHAMGLLGIRVPEKM